MVKDNKMLETKLANPAPCPGSEDLPPIRGLFKTLRTDIRAVFQRDPAARSSLEVLLTYPGLHALSAHRFAHWLWTHHLKLPGRWLSTLTRFFTGIEIHPGAIIGEGFFIDHGMGVVIGETAEIGKNVTLYHGVTLGGVSLVKGKRHPTLKDNVVVGAGAKILGAITIGECSRIGANAVVVKDVPPDAVVVGVPGQIVVRSKPHSSAPDLEHDKLPDMIGASITSVMKRLEVIESNLNLHVTTHTLINGEGSLAGAGEMEIEPGVMASDRIIHPPDHGIWKGEDFII